MENGLLWAWALPFFSIHHVAHLNSTCQQISDFKIVYLKSFIQVGVIFFDISLNSEINGAYNYQFIYAEPKTQLASNGPTT